MKHPTVPALALAAVGALASLAPAASRAETPDDWRFAATIYGWLPSIKADTTFPAGSTTIEVTEGDILDALNFTFMGAFAAQKGDWGLATDVIYLDLGGSKKESVLLVGGAPQAGGVTAKADLTVTGWLWTTAGTYRLVDHPGYTMDLLAGARLLNLGEDLKWTISGDIGNPPIVDPSGKSHMSTNIWDGIVGLKGRAELGEDKKWFIPYYVDVGTGDSDLTWQGIIGGGYAFDWGDVIAVWRYLDYEMPSKDPVQNTRFSGAAIGVTFHF